MKYFLLLPLLLGCSSAPKKSPITATEPERNVCVESCMLRNKAPNLDRGDLMGLCELECR